ncbi:LysR substrate-binding domain-containing protein [Peribacillus sp. JNUCC 23]
MFIKACGSIGFTPRGVFEVQNIVPLYGALAAGFGIALIPEITLMDSLPHDAVKVPIVEPVVRRNVGIIISKERWLLPTEQLFYDFTVDFFANLMDMENELVRKDPYLGLFY